MIMVLLVLFAAVAILFPSFQFKNRWNEAFLVLKSQDLIVTSDRLGILSNISFSAKELQSYLNIFIPASKTNIVSFSQTQNTFKNQIILACNCTNDQIVNITDWFSNVKPNERPINFLVCFTYLEVVNPCLESSDALIIWGRQTDNLLLENENYYKTLSNYINKGSGIIEIRDLTEEELNNRVQKEIFGIQPCIGSCNYSKTISDDDIEMPSVATDQIYQEYKLFYHIPITVKMEQRETIPLNTSLQTCSDSATKTGSLVFRESTFKSWICNRAVVYIDTNGDGVPDLNVSLTIQRNFKINELNFFLSYIEGNERFGITFKPNYMFKDFLTDGGSKTLPVGSQKQIFSAFGDYDDMPGTLDPVVIVNGTREIKTIWMPDFARDPLKIGHDHESLLLSAIYAVSDKKASDVLTIQSKVGYITSYVNVMNKDMFEPYIFNLGLGLPF